MTRTICLLLAITAALTNVSTLAAAGETSDRIMKEKKVTLGVMELEPFVFRQKDGTFAGSDFEIAKAVFSKLGVTNIEAIPVDYASAIPGLKAKRYDAVGSLFIRPDRCKQVVFANPHYQASDGLIVAKGNPKKLASLEDIVAKPDVTVAVTQGGASSKTAQAVGIPSGQLVSLPNITAELAALKAGRVQ
ncbi:extracellular solute-binding protein (family 3), partial [Bradyrhizobium macuxiense]